MKLPSFRQLYSADYPSKYKDLIDILSISLNNGITVLYQALNNGLTLRDNLNATVKDVTVTVDTNGIPTTSTAFTLRGTSQLDGVMVLSAVNQTNSTTYPTSGVFINGNQNANVFTITHITGLQANQQYVVRVVGFQQ